MKTKHLKFCLLFTFISLNVFSQEKSNFKIEIYKETSGETWLICHEGCNWTDLKIDQPKNKEGWFINEDGMQSEEKKKSHFSFTIRQNKDTFLLKGRQNTHWSELKFKYNEPIFLTNEGIQNIDIQ